MPNYYGGGGMINRKPPTLKQRLLLPLINAAICLIDFIMKLFGGKNK